MSAKNKYKQNTKGAGGGQRLATKAAIPSKPVHDEGKENGGGGSSSICQRDFPEPQQQQQEEEQGWCVIGKKQNPKKQLQKENQNQQKQSGQRVWPQPQEGQHNRPQKLQQNGGQQIHTAGRQRQQERETLIGGPNHSQQQGTSRREKQQQSNGWRKDPPQNRNEAGPIVITPKPGNIERGTIGKPGTVDVNYVTLDLSDMPNVAYHYDVKIMPERPKKFIRDAFEMFRIKHLNGIAAAFDGKASCYTVDKLPVPKQGKDVEVADVEGHLLHYTIEIKETEAIEVDLASLRNYMKDKLYDKPMRSLQCLEVVLAAPCYERAIRGGRSFYKTSQQGRIELIEGYDLNVGLYQSLVLGDSPLVNVDISHKTFPMAISLIQYLERYGLNHPIDRSTTLGGGAMNTISSFLKNLKIIYEPPKCFGTAPRTFKVNGLTAKDANTQTFTVEKTTQSVAAYFKKRGYNLKYPLLNCLHVGPILLSVYLPMELCRIDPNQILNRKDSEQLVSEVVKHAATSTNTRKLKILHLLDFFQHNLNPIVSRFGLKIGKNFITLSMRLLTPPRLEYKGGQTVIVRNGSWRMDRMEFIKTPKTMHKWAVLYPQSANTFCYEKILKMTEMVLQVARATQVSLESKPIIFTFLTENHLDARFVDLKSLKCDLVFVVIPKRGITYSDIKTKAELKYGLLTQCIKQQNVESRMNHSMVGNILLKLNSKLNGVNHKIKEDPFMKLNNVMYLGGDVAHPSPDQPDIPSVVGMVATHDPFGFCYNMQYRLQSGHLENIEDMLSIILEFLTLYKKSQNRFPEHIIYYRDGVSEGQFNIVKQVELRSINMACSRLGFKPKLTCLIVVKRHHTRFFPKGEGDSKFNKYNNVEPGTVVDQTIVHPNEMQFFMVSHQALQGTARPTRYNVIENTGNLNINLLQQMTFNLCHLFPRCNRSVSYPAPVYLAHLVAARGRVYLSIGRTVGSPEEEYLKRSIKPDLLAKNPMFFV